MYIIKTNQLKALAALITVECENHNEPHVSADSLNTKTTVA
jgi:hypothetical protein